MFLQVISYFFIFAVVLFLVYVTTRFIGNKTGKAVKGKYINVIETISLGIDKQIHLVRAGDQFILIAASGRHIEFLTAVKLDDYDTDVIKQEDNMFDFKVFFDKYLQMFKTSKNEKVKNSLSGKMSGKEGDVFRSNLNRLRNIINTKDKDSVKDGDDNIQ